MVKTLRFSRWFTLPAALFWMVAMGCREVPAPPRSQTAETKAGIAVAAEKSKGSKPSGDIQKPVEVAAAGLETHPAGSAAQPVTLPIPIDPARAMQYTREVVAFGPRPVGSEAHKKLEAYLRSHLKFVGAQLEDDVFTASTPAGPLAMDNIIGKIPGTREGIVVIASHYDTLYGRKDFVGANDGGSSTGLLLELARQLESQGRRRGYSVWLVFFDGEEAIRQWSDTDSLYGSRHLAEKWKQDGTAKKIKALLLADMIGDADLNVLHELNSTPWLEDLIYQAASGLGYQSHFFGRDDAVGDDHSPFLRAGVPSADLIDFDYGYNNVFWHTANDTLDKLSPKSLQITGDVILETVRLLDQR
jgi:Zn-dependent M28 family amino/carboxypeptidase